MSNEEEDNIQHKYKASSDMTLDDGGGEVTLWRIQNFDKVRITDESEIGQFYDGDSYIILYSYQVRLLLSFRFFTFSSPTFLLKLSFRVQLLLSSFASLQTHRFRHHR